MRQNNPRQAVSVVIPVYNQARYLRAAIESALAQTRAPREVLVIDDGSTDDPGAVAAGFPGVRCLRQENRGTAAARNRGVAESRGDLLVFLDADDRLLPDALEKGLAALDAHPDSVLVFGRTRRIAEDGSALGECQPPYLEQDDYAAFLTGCPIWHPASVLCRRFVFEQGLSFDGSLKRSSDYLFYLTVARRWPVFGHNEIVSEYRQHGASKSCDSVEMLRAALAILRSQRRFVEDAPRRRAAWRRGIAQCRRNFYAPAAVQTWKRLQGRRELPRGLRDAAFLLRLSPAVAFRAGAGLLRRARRTFGAAGTGRGRVA